MSIFHKGRLFVKSIAKIESQQITTLRLLATNDFKFELKSEACKPEIDLSPKVGYRTCPILHAFRLGQAFKLHGVSKEKKQDLEKMGEFSMSGMALRQLVLF